MTTNDSAWRVIARNVQHLPTDLPGACLHAVLILDGEGLQRAYAGIVRELDADRVRDEWVAERGARLTFREALAHFPRLDRERHAS